MTRPRFLRRLPRRRRCRPGKQRQSDTNRQQNRPDSTRRSHIGQTCILSIDTCRRSRFRSEAICLVDLGRLGCTWVMGELWVSNSRATDEYADLIIRTPHPNPLPVGPGEGEEPCTCANHGGWARCPARAGATDTRRRGGDTAPYLPRGGFTR
jgi:hypothetical protein